LILRLSKKKTLDFTNIFLTNFFSTQIKNRTIYDYYIWLLYINK